MRKKTDGLTHYKCALSCYDNLVPYKAGRKRVGKVAILMLREKPERCTNNVRGQRLLHPYAELMFSTFEN